MWEKLRKFGMQHCDLPTMLMNIAFLFKALTLNIDSRFSKPIPTIFYVIAYSFAIIYNYTYSWSVVWFMLWKSVKTEDFVAAMIVFSLGLTSKIGVAKFIYVYVARNDGEFKNTNNFVGYSLYESYEADRTGSDRVLLGTPRQQRCVLVSNSGRP
ncbi:hypothetical protein ACJJTC_016206 [Scirpophaga incertulas]